MKTLQFNVSIWALTLLTASSTLAACAQSRGPVRAGSARVFTPPTATTSPSAPATAPGVASSAAVDSGKVKLLAPLQQMVAKLKKLSPTGDPDFDYSFQAKIQSQGLQDLLKQEVANGKDAAMQKMAQQLLESTTADIAALDANMRQLKPTRPNQAFTQQQNQNVEAMSLKLQQVGTTDTMGQPYDETFATLLMSQRQDAIDMATTYLQYGKNDATKAYAQQVVDQSKKQMSTLKTMVKSTVK